MSDSEDGTTGPHRPSALEGSGPPNASTIDRMAHWEFDPHTGAGFWSNEMYRLFARDPTKGVPPFPEFMEMVHPDDRASFLRVHNGVVESGQPATQSFRSHLAGRPVSYFEASVAPLKDGEGRTLRLVGFILDVSERRKIDEALRTSEAQLSAALKLAHLGHWEYEPSADRFTFNDPFYALLRTSAESEGGYTMSMARYTERFLHPGDITVFREETERALRTTDPRYSSEFEHRVVFGDGEAGRVAIRTVIVKDEHGRTVKTYGLSQDITARKRAEIELLNRERRFRALLEHGGDSIALIDANNRILYLSPAVKAVEGYEPEELLGRDGLENTHPDDLPLVARVVEQLVAHPGRPIPVLWRRRHKDGRWLWLEGIATNLLDDPAVGAIVTNYRDVTQRKQAEEELRRREEHFRSLIENAADLITVVDPEGKVRFQSPSAERVLGYPPLGKTNPAFLEALHPDDVVSVKAALTRARETPNAPVSFNYRIRHRSGAWRMFESVGQGTLREGEETLVVVNSRDVTESRTLEEQLQQAQKMESIGRLAGGVAHDFNNLLGVIVGYGEMLQARLPPEEDLRKPVEQVLKAAQRAAALTRQLLAFSRKQVLQPKVLDLNGVVAETERLLERLIGEDIVLDTVLAERLPAVLADPGQMQQVVMNLAVNARDAMPRGGRIRLETASAQVDGETIDSGGVPAGRYVTITVSDTGDGLDPLVRPHLFEPFFTTKGLGKGTGLGLATVYGIVKQSGGHIAVESEPGRGAEFRVFLPALPAEQEVSLAAQERVAPIPPRGHETVLLAEDDTPLRELVRETLEAQGYAVLAAPDAQAACRLAEVHGTFDLLLTDVVMPGMGGPALARRLADGRSRFRVLYVSGYTDDALLRHDVLHDRMWFLQKPFTTGELLRKVREVLDAD